MPRWPFALTAGGVDIAIALAPSSSSIVVESRSRRPLPLSCRRAVHRRCATPSITVNSPSRRPSPPIRCALGLSPPHSRCPLLSRSCHTVHCRRGSVAPSFAVEEPSRRPLLSRTVAASCVARSFSFYFSFAVVQIFSPLAALPSCPCRFASTAAAFPSPPCPARSRRPRCSPPCLRPRQSPSFISSRSHRSDSSAPFHRPRADAPSSLIQTDADAGLTITPLLVAAPVSTPPATAAAYTTASVVVHPF